MLAGICWLVGMCWPVGTYCVLSNSSNWSVNAEGHEYLEEEIGSHECELMSHLLQSRAQSRSMDTMQI